MHQIADIYGFYIHTTITYIFFYFEIFNLHFSLYISSKMTQKATILAIFMVVLVLGLLYFLSFTILIPYNINLY